MNGHLNLVIAGQPGRPELFVIIFRRHDEAEFHEKELPELRDAFAAALAQRGARLFYPYSRSAAPLPIGTSAVLRNPILSSDTQLARAIDEAREEADLSARLLRRAIKRELMNVVLSEAVHSVYEPIVDTGTLTVLGYEALARGPHGTALEAPLEMFRIAEETDLVYQLDCLCRRQAIAGAVGRAPGTKLFMNIRPSVFHDAGFQPDALRATLDRCELRPDDVVFEISEQESIANFDTFRRARDDYGRLGFQFALDDTGRDTRASRRCSRSHRSS